MRGSIDTAAAPESSGSYIGHFTKKPLQSAGFSAKITLVKCIFPCKK